MSKPLAEELRPNNLDEYLKEEARALPSRPEVEHFYTEIDTLKERVERLTAKIAAAKPA